MALISANMQLHGRNTNLSLEAKTGQSLLVKNIRVFGATTTWGRYYIEKTTVGYLPAGGAIGNQLSPLIYGTFKGHTVLSYFGEAGLFSGYPVAEGERFLTDIDLDGNTLLEIDYDLYEAGDFTSASPNGSASDTLQYMIYGSYAASIGATGAYLFQTPANPSEFPAFPFGVAVPARTEIKVSAIVGSPIFKKAAAVSSYSKYIKMAHDRTVLYNEDRLGVAFWGRYKETADEVYRGSVLGNIGNLSHIDPMPPYLITDPITYRSGESLDVYVEYGTDDATFSVITAAEQTIGFFVELNRV